MKHILNLDKDEKKKYGIFITPNSIINKINKSISIYAYNKALL